MPGARAQRSAYRGRVYESAPIPKFVDAAINSQRRQVAFETLAVIAHLFDNVVGPAIVQPNHLPEPTLRATEPLNDRMGVFRFLMDVLRREAKLLGLDHREQ